MLDTRKLLLTRFIALVLTVCVSASTFVAINATASVDYTGSAVTTDDFGTPKTTYVSGDRVYVNVELYVMGTPYNGSVTVSLVRTSDDATISHYHAHTNNPVVGSNSGYITGSYLLTGTVISETMTYDVVVVYGLDEIARTSIIVQHTGLRISPSAMFYYPGDTISIDLALTTVQASSLFYVAVVNDTLADFANWTSQAAPSGHWAATWTLPTDIPNGDYDVYVRDQANHAVWYHSFLLIQKYVIAVLHERDNYLAGETADITYEVFDVSTFAPSTGVVVSFAAHWLNSADIDCWVSGTLPGSEGVHSYQIPIDIATYSDTVIRYWANETATGRSAYTEANLYTELLQGTVTVDHGPYCPGGEVQVQVEAEVGYQSLDGASVDITVMRNGTAVPGMGAVGLTTGWEGSITYRIDLPSDTAPGSYTVVATISKVGHSVTRMATFDVEHFGYITITLDRDYYLSGDTVVATVHTIWDNRELQNATVNYIVAFGAGDVLTGATNSGSVSFVIPTTEPNHFMIQVFTEVAGYQIVNMADASVLSAEVELAAESPQYAPLDTIVFNYAILTRLPVVSAEYSILDGIGLIVSSGVLSTALNGSISYALPVDPSESYTCALTVDVLGVESMTVYHSVSIYGDYDLEITIGDSPYLSGAYRPGDTLDIGYEIVLRGAPSLSIYRLELATTLGDSSFSLLTTSNVGTLQLQIPESAPDGMVYVIVSLYDPIVGVPLGDGLALITVSGNADHLDIAFDDMQNETESLKNQLNATLDALNASDDNNSEMMDGLDALQQDLDSAMDALNASLDQLEAMQDNMSGLQDELEAVNGQISDQPRSDMTTALLSVALIAVAAIAVVMALLLLRARRSG